MSAGIAPNFCTHFSDLRACVQQEKTKRGTLHAISRPEKQCWVYNLVTKQKCYEKPTIEDLKHSSLSMREHAIANRVLEIHLPKIACGKDRMNWPEVREFLINIFRNTPLRVTIHMLDEDTELDSQTDHLDSTLPASMSTDQIHDQCGDKSSSGDSVLDEGTVASDN